MLPKRKSSAMRKTLQRSLGIRGTPEGFPKDLAEGKLLEREIA